MASCCESVSNIQPPTVHAAQLRFQQLLREYLVLVGEWQRMVVQAYELDFGAAAALIPNVERASRRFLSLALVRFVRG